MFVYYYFRGLLTMLKYFAPFESILVPSTSVACRLSLPMNTIFISGYVLPEPKSVFNKFSFCKLDLSR